QSYDPDADEDMLNRAYVYGLRKHGTQLRASGDPYFSHPVEVAGILAEMKLDSSSIITGLLHDTIEDTDATRDEIAGMFGEDIALETMDLYAPLASRIGMERVKRELEELAFAELNPDGRASVQARLGYLLEKGDKIVPEVEAELLKSLKEGGLSNAQVSGREK